jgi:lysyl-tRNA synthetase class 2
MPSSVIQSFIYEGDISRLTITFTTGRVYEYFLVPPSVATAFKAAPSKGAYFNARIRDHFAYREITPAGSKAS